MGNLTDVLYPCCDGSSRNAAGLCKPTAGCEATFTSLDGDVLEEHEGLMYAPNDSAADQECCAKCSDNAECDFWTLEAMGGDLFQGANTVPNNSRRLGASPIQTTSQMKCSLYKHKEPEANAKGTGTPNARGGYRSTGFEYITITKQYKCGDMVEIEGNLEQMDCICETPCVWEKTTEQTLGEYNYLGEKTCDVYDIGTTTGSVANCWNLAEDWYANAPIAAQYRDAGTEISNVQGDVAMEVVGNVGNVDVFEADHDSITCFVGIGASCVSYRGRDDFRETFMCKPTAKVQPAKAFSYVFSDSPALSTKKGGGADDDGVMATNTAQVDDCASGSEFMEEGKQCWVCTEANQEPPADEYGLRWFEAHYNSTGAGEIGAKHLNADRDDTITCNTRDCASSSDTNCLEKNNERATCEMKFNDVGDEERTGCEWDRWSYTCLPEVVLSSKRGDAARLYNWVSARTQDEDGKPIYNDMAPARGFGASWLGATPKAGKEALDAHKSFLFCVLKGISKTPPPTKSLIKGGSFERPLAKTWNTASAYMDPDQGPPFWSVISGGVDWGKMQQEHNMCEVDCAYDGSQFIDLCAQEEGKIMQEVELSAVEHFCGFPAGSDDPSNPGQPPIGGIPAGAPVETGFCQQTFTLSYAVNAHPTCGATTKTTEVLITSVQEQQTYSPEDGYDESLAGHSPADIRYTETFTRPIGKPGSALAKKGWTGNHPYFGWKEFHHQWTMRSHEITVDVDCSAVTNNGPSIASSGLSRSVLKLGVSFEAVNDEYSCGCMMLDDIQLNPADDTAECKDTQDAPGAARMVQLPAATLDGAALREWREDQFGNSHTGFGWAHKSNRLR